MPAYTSRADRLFFDERGSGDPVVVLGGGPARHPDYLGDLGGLGRDHRLVVPHLRGIGDSPFPSDPALASWWEQAADVEALRLHLGLERLTVLGHSAGTRIALAFGARFPGSLARLMLVTPPVAGLVDAPPDVPSIRSRREQEPSYAAALANAQQGPPTAADDDRLTAWQRSIGPLAYARWDVPQQEHARIGGWNAAAVAAYGAVAPPEDFRAELGAVPVPVRVIAGAEDGIVGVAGPLELADLFDDGSATVIEGAGHYPWVDRPSAFVAAVEAALDSRPAGQSM